MIKPFPSSYQNTKKTVIGEGKIGWSMSQEIICQPNKMAMIARKISLRAIMNGCPCF
jgi:hypothetical protein